MANYMHRKRIQESVVMASIEGERMGKIKRGKIRQRSRTTQNILESVASK